jgi:mono/diheme cytochrome c family protein
MKVKTLALLAIPVISRFAIPVIYCAALTAQTPRARATPVSGAQLPDGMGKDVTQKVCGSTCHGPEIVTGTGRTREQWAAVVNAMVTRGAKASDAELAQIAEYLSTNLGPNVTVNRPPARGGRPGAPVGGPARGPGPLGAGAADSHVVDVQRAERGKSVYIAECITCHGNKARGANANMTGAQKGSDLVRSLTVLHDRYGNTIGPFLAKGHPLQSGKPSSSLTPQQVGDLAHFLHQRVYETLRGGPGFLEVQNVLTGDPKAGAAYFSGAGKCATCHSPTGDLAGIGKKYDPPTIQSKFLFPRTVGFRRAGAGATASKPVTVTVTQPSGEVVQGVLEKMDDFNVSLRDSRGEYHSFKRTPSLKVEKNDPYAAHVDLLDQYTDKDIHDVVAYLETLK